MKRNGKVLDLSMSALLVALAILIPMSFPRIVLPPASYTLASHVPIFIAMFLSPLSAVVVSIGATLGFFIAGFDITIVARAGTHLIFAFVGAMILQKKPSLLDKPFSNIIFAALLSVLHAGCEILILLPFYFGGSMQSTVYESGFFRFIILLIGFGGWAHSMLDYAISYFVWRSLRKTDVVKKIKQSS